MAKLGSLKHAADVKIKLGLHGRKTKCMNEYNKQQKESIIFRLGLIFGETR